MKSLTPLFLVFIFSLMFASCEKEVDIKLKTGEPTLVVEGVIETDQLPYVTLTRSMGFFDKIDLNTIDFVNNAQVVVQDLTNQQQITLREYVVDTTVGNQVFSFSIYGPDLNDPNAMAFKGQAEHLYRLSILSEGKSYEGVTKIPNTAPLDSVWVEAVPGLPGYAALKAYYNDPDTVGNSVRIETLRKRKEKDGLPEVFETSFNSVYDDAIINGTRIPLSIDLGYNKAQEIKQEDFRTLGYLKTGDTVTLKWSGIDRQVFKFWELMTVAEGSVGNPFASPTKVIGNVKGALGVWGGYGPLYYTVIDTLQ